VALVDLVQHSRDQGERCVAGQLDHPEVESRRGLPEGAGLVRRRNGFVHNLFEFVEGFFGAGFGKKSRGGGLDRPAGDVHVGDGGAGKLEQQ
jgi:hypothetical protein